MIDIMLGIIAIAPISVAAGVALHQSIQNVYYIKKWHSFLEKLWNTQRRIDNILHAEITDLESVVIRFGDQAVSLQRLLLRCV